MEQINNTMTEPVNDTIPTKNCDDNASNVPPKRKRGIVYLSTIPKYMNITKIREIFSAYGKVGRVYLQLAESDTDQQRTGKKKRKLQAKHFTEGWIEFESKKVAKRVAALLNNTQVSTRKKSKFYDIIWNVKYLPRFKWVHLSERLAYERAVRKQRLHAEIAQAKREANFFARTIGHSKKSKQMTSIIRDQGNPLPNIVKQRETDSEIRAKGSRKNHSPPKETELLKRLFS